MWYLPINRGPNLCGNSPPYFLGWPWSNFRPKGWTTPKLYNALIWRIFWNFHQITSKWKLGFIKYHIFKQYNFLILQVIKFSTHFLKWILKKKYKQVPAQNLSFQQGNLEDALVGYLGMGGSPLSPLERIFFFFWKGKEGRSGVQFN